MEGAEDERSVQPSFDVELGSRLGGIFPWIADDRDNIFRQVEDADEEIFLLYTLSASEADRIGLGQVDDRSDYLNIVFHLDNLADPPQVLSGGAADYDQAKRSRRPKKDEAKQKTYHKVFMRQNCTSIKSTVGDTGSVVWRSSMHLAHKILYDLSSSAEAKQRNVQDPDQMRKYLLNPVKLPSFRILELGAGTGIIPAAVLSHQEMEARGVSWTATDQYSMMNLLEKNLSQSGAIVKELDWLQASQVYRFGAPSAMVNFLSAFKATDDAQFDLILATDCIFNPSLFPAFLDTLTLFATPRMTGVLVVCELRQSDMLHDFISAWLTHKGRWSICTLEATKVLGPRLSRGSVVWLGWRM